MASALPPRATALGATVPGATAVCDLQPRLIRTSFPMTPASAVP